MTTEQRDRLSAYVSPETTQIIEEVKQQYIKELGVKLTIGQVVDIVFKEYQQGMKKA